MNGERIGEYAAGRDGLIYLPGLESGWYTVTETKAANEYIIDAEPRNVEIKWGKSETLVVENTAMGGLLIVKTDDFLNYPANTGVKIRNIGNYEAMPGDTIRYDIKEVANTPASRSPFLCQNIHCASNSIEMMYKAISDRDNFRQSLAFSIKGFYNDGDNQRMKENMIKSFDYINTPKTLLTPDIVAMLTSIHEHKGKHGLYIEAHADTLTALMEIARIQSTGASNRIEGIHTTDKRLEELVRDKSTPRNRSEQEIAGYRDVLATIHESYDYIQPLPNIILQLHKQLYSFAQSGIGGSYKNSDNYISETDADGDEKVRFKPTPAYLTADAMERLCSAFIEAINKNEHDPLLLISMFLLDFLCVHPFNDGNGRMSRLLTLLLFYRAGYIVVNTSAWKS
jgi:fido (protein-threonine AMPylation protein)